MEAGGAVLYLRRSHQDEVVAVPSACLHDAKLSDGLGEGIWINDNGRGTFRPARALRRQLQSGKGRRERGIGGIRAFRDSLDRHPSAPRTLR